MGFRYVNPKSWRHASAVHRILKQRLVADRIKQRLAKSLAARP